ncbi:hypothetical protein J1N35_014117 [Gossypium stocksii]|uniref:Uncharacterized protein n=1 Tax=Gossypium stocksii TaxID=47602 RepID=A0A9D3VV65_9ROSI|nr:hypothetical protein J1N35_014117 [Gossypium stocksii]
MLKKCSKKSILSKNKASEGKKCLKKSTTEEYNGSGKVPKRLGLSPRGVKSNRSRTIKKKRAKYFLCHGPHELQNYLEQSKLGMVKKKATTKLFESSKGLPPKEEMSLASDFEKEVAMRTLKLGPIKLNSRKATELVESLERLPPNEEVSCASNLEEVVMQTLKLGSMSLISIDSSEEVPPKGKVGCASEFAKMVMQTKQLTRVNAASKFNSKGTTRALREWVRENVIDRNSKLVIIAPNASQEGLSVRWGSFDPGDERCVLIVDLIDTFRTIQNL